MVLQIQFSPTNATAISLPYGPRTPDSMMSSNGLLRRSHVSPSQLEPRDDETTIRRTVWEALFRFYIAKGLVAIRASHIRHIEGRIHAALAKTRGELAEYTGEGVMAESSEDEAMDDILEHEMAIDSFRVRADFAEHSIQDFLQKTWDDVRNVWSRVQQRDWIMASAATTACMIDAGCAEDIAQRLQDALSGILEVGSKVLGFEAEDVPEAEDLQAVRANAVREIVNRLAVGLVETRSDPRVPDPTGSLGNPTRPTGYPRAYSRGSGRVGL